MPIAADTSVLLRHAELRVRRRIARQAFEVFVRWFDSPTARLDRMRIAREG